MTDSPKPGTPLPLTDAEIAEDIVLYLAKFINFYPAAHWQDETNGRCGLCFERWYGPERHQRKCRSLEIQAKIKAYKASQSIRGVSLPSRKGARK